MKKLLFIALLLTISAFAQTQYVMRMDRAEYSVSGVLHTLPGAQITVCQYNALKLCLVPVDIYSDPNGTNKITQPLIADSEGNYQYFAPNGAAYVEQVKSPGVATKTYAIVPGNTDGGVYTFNPPLSLASGSVSIDLSGYATDSELASSLSGYATTAALAGYATSLAAKADDSAVPHKTGNETIAGNKTFTGSTTVASLVADSVSTTAIGLKVPSSEAGVVVFDGDSTVVGFGGSPFWPTLVSLPSGYSMYLPALGGAQLTDLQQRALTYVDSHYNPQAAHNILFVKAYTNDFDHTDVIGTYNRLVAYCRERKKVGWEVIVANMTSRVGSDTKKNDLNALINYNWPAFADDLADLASHSEIGADGAYANTTYFLPDGYHLTNAGYAFFRMEAESAINRIVARNGVPLRVTLGAAGGLGGAAYGYSAFIPSDATVLGTAKLNGGATLFSPAPTPSAGFIAYGRNATSGMFECKDPTGRACINFQSVQSCGSTTACSNAAVTASRIVFGTVALTAGTATVTGIFPAFTSDTSFLCTGVDQTSAAAVKIVNASSSSITVTGTGTDTVAYQCVGN